MTKVFINGVEMNKKVVEENIKEIIQEVEGGKIRDSLLDTPRRASESFFELLNGYNRKFDDEIKLFDNDEGYNDIIFSGRISFFSICEHHLLPFFGNAYVGYIPTTKIVGLSKLSRVIDIHSRRLQNQERITVQSAKALHEASGADGVIVVLEGQHLCNISRGVEQINSNMKTIYSLGKFSEKELKNRFLRLIDEKI